MVRALALKSGQPRFKTGSDHHSLVKLLGCTCHLVCLQPVRIHKSSSSVVLLIMFHWP